MENKKIKIRRKIDSMIDDGLTLKEMANMEGVSRQRIQQYLAKTDKYGTWREGRKRKKIREKRQEMELDKKRVEEKENFRTTRASLLSIIKSHYYDLRDDSTPEGWAERKAFEYIFSKEWTSYSFETLTEIFKKYKEAEIASESLSLEELAKGTGIVFSSIGKIFQTVRLEPMFGTRRRISPISIAQKRIINILGRAELSNEDIGYFMSLPGHVIKQNRKFKPKSKPLGIFRGYYLTYRLASQIYDADDTRYFDEFSKQEIAELLNTSSRAIDCALENRKYISKVIDMVLGIAKED